VTFAALVRERQDEIVRRWEARVERAVPGTTVTDEQRRQVTRLLERIADGLRDQTAREAPSTYQATARRYMSIPLVGDSRRAIQDYVLLRDAVFDVAEEAGIAPAYRDLRVLLDAIASEITADALTLAESERELFFRTIPDLLCVASFDGYFLRVNPSFNRVLGWTDEELRSRPIRDFVHPDDRESTLREIAKIAGGAFTLRFENRYLVKGGGYRLLAWAASPVVESGFMYAVARDVTETRRYEKEREETLAALQHAAEFRERFVGIVAHDLRTPLASISTGSQLLMRMEGVPERVTRVAQRLNVTALRTSKMIGDLMDFTRVRLGSGIPIERSPADLAAIVRQVVDETDSVYPGRSVQLSAEGSVPGRWDGDRLAQLVGNLVKNALDYSPLDSPVRIRLLREEDEARMEVRNRNLEGPIPPTQVRELFEPFYKGASRTRKREGLGLGLYIANEIAKAHGGTIDVTSDAREGTCLSVRLPTG